MAVSYFAHKQGSILLIFATLLMEANNKKDILALKIYHKTKIFNLIIKLTEIFNIKLNINSVLITSNP